jgi:hypothetical protein
MALPLTFGEIVEARIREHSVKGTLIRQTTEKNGKVKKGKWVELGEAFANIWDIDSAMNIGDSFNLTVNYDVGETLTVNLTNMIASDITDDPGFYVATITKDAAGATMHASAGDKIAFIDIDTWVAGPACGTNPWITSVNSFPLSAFLPAVAIADVSGTRYMYVFDRFETNLYRSVINVTTGDIGTWSIDPGQKPVNSRSFSNGNTDKFWVLAGGFSGDINTHVLDVYVGTFQVGGSISWVLSPNALQKFSTHGRLVFVGNYVYVVGGGIGANSGVQFATWNATTGDIGPWSLTTSIPHSIPTTALTLHGLCATSDTIYVSGGTNNNSANNPQDTTFWAKPDPGTGVISAWNSGPALPTARSSHAMETIGGALYIYGGRDAIDVNGFNDVQCSVIQPNGSIGPWQQLPNDLPGVPNGQTELGQGNVSKGQFMYAVTGNATNVIRFVEVL